jgi:hypothetical protein
VLLLRFIFNVIDIYFLYISSRNSPCKNLSCAYFTQKTDPRKLALKSSVLGYAKEANKGAFHCFNSFGLVVSAFGRLDCLPMLPGAVATVQ